MEVLDLQLNDFDEVYANGTSNGSVDAAFRKISKNATAFLIWRVENMSLVSLPKEQYGIFYDKDSYVIYASSQYGHLSGVDTVSREIKGISLEYHIHFWLGSSTTADKSGVAAYKTVELDNFLNGSTTQHRETQGNESARFKSYFKSGLRILKHDLKESNLPILYKMRGKRTSFLTQLEKVSWDYFNSAEIFLLHTPKFLFVWIGRAANAAEKLHASKISLELKDQFDISNIIFVDDGYEKTLPDGNKTEFNKFLTLEKRHVLPENESNNSEAIESSQMTLKLYKCSENNGKYRVTELKLGPLSQNDLEPEDVFIIDQESLGIWVWTGRRANNKEKGEALRNARGFVKKKKYPNSTKVTRVVDGFEPLEFKMLFASWKNETIKSIKAPKPTTLVSKLDAETMLERPSLASEIQLVDDGSGSVTLWRVKKDSIIELSKERHGYFFSHDCYIVLYTYQASNEQKHLLYYWLGSHASHEEITTATIKISEIDENLGGLGFQARVIQNQEPAHFLQIFKGRLIVFKGKGTDYDESGRNIKHPSHFFLQIFGSTSYTSKAMQIQPKASCLNSNYCFVLKKGKHAFIWCGNYSTGDQREMAKGFAGKNFELILEGKEKHDFFDILGGKVAYFTQINKTEGDPRPPRLFHCSNNNLNGNLKIEEILFFTQNDLLPEDVMLLDFFIVLYVWIGNLSSKEDQRNSMKNAIDYLQLDPSGRNMNIPIIHINQGCEPPTFTGFFPAWSQQVWQGYKSFGKLRQDIEKNNTDCDGNEKSNGCIYQKSGHSDFDQYDKYPVSILKEPNDKLPARVDPLNKELHLTHDDFVQILKMPYIDFEKLPRWKQQELKKKAGLF